MQLCRAPVRVDQSELEALINYARVLPNGTITEFAVPTSGSQPFGITTGPDGSLWFTEYAANKFGRFIPPVLETEFPLTTANSSPQALVAGPDGNFWVTEMGANKIARVTPQGSVTEFPLPTSGSEPRNITVGPDGALWFAEYGGSRVGRITTTGVISQFNVSGATAGIATGPDGNLWFTELSAGKIGRLTPGGILTEFNLASGSQPAGITAGPDGNLWFTEFGTNKIGSISTSGVVMDSPIPTASSHPIEITVGPDGNLWFVEYTTNKIGKISPTTARDHRICHPHDQQSGLLHHGRLGRQPLVQRGLHQPDRPYFRQRHDHGVPAADGRQRTAGYDLRSRRQHLVHRGDGNIWFNETGVSQFGRIVLMVTQAATTATATCSASSPVFGQSVTFTANVSGSPPGQGTPTGTVTFLDGTTTLGTATLSSGQATLTLSSLAVGNHTITVFYGGDSNFLSTTSSTLTEAITKAASATTITSAPIPRSSGRR